MEGSGIHCPTRDGRQRDSGQASGPGPSALCTVTAAAAALWLALLPCGHTSQVHRVPRTSGTPASHRRASELGAPLCTPFPFPGVWRPGGRPPRELRACSGPEMLPLPALLRSSPPLDSSEAATPGISPESRLPPSRAQRSPA